MRVWIDLANSPHPLLFAPIASRLEREGHTVLLTARDNAQTAALARERWPDVSVIGSPSPRSRVAKVGNITQRVGGLRRWALRHQPDVAVSHNSYAQLVCASLTRIPAVTAMDFEHQPSNHLAFRLANTVIVPEALPSALISRQGARPHKLVRYPGLKEELYVGDFEPDADILAKVGLTPRPRVVVVARTAPTRAIYHDADNPLFARALAAVCTQEATACVVLTRHPEQIAAVEALKLRNCIIPRETVDSRSLMYAADLVLGAGGTMTREAALLGVPTWTMFAGRTPAVDVVLESSGALRRLEDAIQLQNLAPRPTPPQSLDELRDHATKIEAVIVEAVLRTGEMNARRRATSFTAG